MASDTNPTTHLDTLIQGARALANQGEANEAAHLYAQVLAARPNHTEALGFLANHAFQARDFTRSALLLQRAVSADPRQPMLHQNLGVVLRLNGQPEAALQSFERVIALAPNYALAHLQKGRALQEINRLDEAVKSYLSAWNIAPELEQTRQAPETPAGFKALLQEAADAIQKAREHYIDDALAPLWDKLDESARSRVNRASRCYLGKGAPAYLHDLQRPSFIYYPDITPRMFFAREDFAWMREFETHTAEIRDELLGVLDTVNTLQPYVQLNNADGSQWETLNHSRAWSSLHLYQGGERNDTNCARCPRTAQLVEQLPLAQCPGHAPEALFSVLQPGAHIPPHVGLGNYKSVVHLPLIIPPHCSIRVGTETRQWTEGQCLVFDDSFEHEAWNRSDAVRVVLILDAWNPALSEPEQQAVSALIGGIDRFHREFGPHEL